MTNEMHLNITASIRKFILTAQTLVGSALSHNDLADVSAETDALLQTLEDALAEETDGPSMNVLIHRTKIDIYNIWLNKITDLAKNMHPELSEPVRLLSEMYGLLFNPADLEEGRSSTENYRMTDEFNDPADRALYHNMPRVTVRQRIKRFFRPSLSRWLPPVGWIPQYHRIGQEDVDVSTRNKRLRAAWRNFRYDFMAGLSCGVVSVPQGLAYALLAGLPPIQGLYTAFITPLVYALFGTSRQVSIGPVAVAALVVRTVLASLTSDVTPLEGAMALAIVVGVAMVLLGVLRLGYISNFLSQPVLHGFNAAAALMIAFSQLKDLLGISFGYQEYWINTVIQVAVNLPNVHGITVAVGACCMVFLILMKIFLPRLPKELICVAIAIGVSYGTNLSAHGVRILDTIPGGLPGVMVPRASVMLQVLPMSVLVALIIYAESISIIKLYSRKFGYKDDADQELVALGITNLTIGFFQGIPSGGTVGRSAVNAGSGARTQIAGVFSGLVSMITLLLLTGLFRYLPYTALAANVIVAVAALIDISVPRRLWRVSKLDCVMYFLAVLGTLFGGVELGIVISMGVSALVIVLKASHPHTAILGRLPNTVVYRDMRKTEHAVRSAGIVVFRVDSIIFFANADYLSDKLAKIASVALREGSPSAIVLDCSAVTDMDASGAVILMERIVQFSEKGVMFLFACCSNRVRGILARAGLEQLLGDDHFFDSVHAAVVAVETGKLTIKKVPKAQPATTCGTRLIGFVKRKLHRKSGSTISHAQLMSDSERDGAVPASVNGSESQRSSESTTQLQDESPRHSEQESPRHMEPKSPRRRRSESGDLLHTTDVDVTVVVEPNQ